MCVSYFKNSQEKTIKEVTKYLETCDNGSTTHQIIQVQVTWYLAINVYTSLFKKKFLIEKFVKVFNSRNLKK